MKSSGMMVSVFLFLSVSVLYAADFSGTYGAFQDGEEITLSLVQDPEGRVNGTMVSEGEAYPVRAQLNGERIHGIINIDGEPQRFSARLTPESLILTVVYPEEEYGVPGEAAEVVTFRRMGAGGLSDRKAASMSRQTEQTVDSKSMKVIINGMVLSEEQIAEAQKIYSIKPIPGTYWYDPRSGLYGAVGFPAYGFMLPGHNYGKLQQNASNGNTGVFVNGRELPAPEWSVWSGLLGYAIQPGRYWLDASGNAGYEGNPVPTENLYMAAQRNLSQGSGSPGDNFWSSRFSSGNYDSGNQRGYVSVPGHGPVGYGF